MALLIMSIDTSIERDPEGQLSALVVGNTLVGLLVNHDVEIHGTSHSRGYDSRLYPRDSR